MRLVLDTNTVVAGLLWHGPPRSILDYARQRQVSLFISTPLLLELNDVLHRPKFAPRLALAMVTPDQLVIGYAALCRKIASANIAHVVLADPDDDAVIACALAAKADAIVSGDRHLLDIGIYRGIRIINAAESLAFIQSN